MKYPNVIFFRLKKYNNIDEFINKNQDKFDCTLNITDDDNELNKLYNTNYHLLVTYGDNEYDFIIKKLSQRFFSKWIHNKDISNIEEFNNQVNTCYINNCINNRELNRPTFSIFTTCYNSYHKINRALKSILNQTLNDWEWVILDDSPDESHFDYLKKTLKDNRIRLYSKDKNSGNIGNVKNEVIGLCRGKYILELDHDDEITENLLQESVNIFEKDNEVGFIYWDFINIYENGNNFYYGNFISLGYGGYYTQKLNNKWVNVYITPNINNITTSYLVSMPNHPRIWRRNVLNKLEDYSEYLPICDDFEILLRTCINTKIVKVCDIGYIQYMNDENNNFSLIRNKEINRLGPKYISPLFFKNYKVHEKMKKISGYEDENYIKQHSQIWKRKNYKHNFMNKRLNNNYDKIYCILGHKNINKIEKYYDNKKNDIIVLDNCLSIETLQDMLDKRGYERVKCYVLNDCNEYELIKYFKLMYKYTENYEIIINNFSSRDNLINTIIDMNKYNSYLEIGIEDGITFQDIEIENKIGVDPSPQYKDKNVIIKTSDNFFKTNIKIFDCIFIDGMHKSQYVLRDLNNSIKFLNKDGIIIIDDILPLNKEEQNDKPLNYYYKHNILKSKCNWTGDVWKVIYELLLNYNEYIEEYTYYENNNYRGIFCLKIKEKFNINKINNYSYDKDYNKYYFLLKFNNFLKKNYKVAVLTSNYGNYDYFHDIDNIKNYKIFDWYYFTDDEKIKSNYWNIIKKKYHDSKSNSMMSEKYYKIQHHNIDIIKDYDYIIWIDSAFNITNDNFVLDTIELIENNNFVINYNPELKTIKEELHGSFQVHTKYGNTIENQYNSYIKDGLPSNFINYSAGFFIKKLNDKLNKFFDKWWNEILNYSFNDQISLSYLSWKNKFIPDTLLQLNYYNNDLFGIYTNHKNQILNKKSLFNYNPSNYIFNDILIFDNFIYEKLLNESVNNIKNYNKSLWRNEYIEDKQINKYYINDINIIDKETLKIFNYFSSQIFIDWLCEITKIDNLLWDDQLFGGGIHKTKKNGKLDIHSDFNTLKNSKKYRRINILLYLNKDWNKNYNGELELWNEQMNMCYKTVEPIFNRMVILDTYTNHGHPKLWNDESDRLSLAFYYYTKEKPSNIKNETYHVEWKTILTTKSIIPIKYENKNIIIIDNFYNDIDDVRIMALQQDYNVEGNYPGLRTKSFANENIKLMFEKYIGKKIINWPNEYNGSYQYTTEKMDSWVHRDQTVWAGIIYLTPGAPLLSGTAFFKHKRTGIENLEEYNNSKKDIQKELDNDSQNMNKWEMIDYVGNKYNRLVLFQGSRNHRSMKYFGNNITNGRLFQTWFFDTE